MVATLPLLTWGLHDRGSDVVVELGLSEHFASESKPRLEEILSAFRQLARAGMLTRSSAAGIDARFDPTFRPSAAGGQGFAECWVVMCEGIDAGTFRLLANSLMNGLLGQSQNLRLSIESSTSGRASEIHVSALQRIPYPAACAPLPFSVDDRLVDPLRREVIVRIQFDEPLTDDVLGLLERALKAWEKVVSSGGFVDPASTLRPLSPRITHAECFRISEFSAEYAVYNANSPLDSMNLVLNLLASVHRNVAPIAAVELE